MQALAGCWTFLPARFMQGELQDLKPHPNESPFTGSQRITTESNRYHLFALSKPFRLSLLEHAGVAFKPTAGNPVQARDFQENPGLFHSCQKYHFRKCLTAALHKPSSTLYRPPTQAYSFRSNGRCCGRSSRPLHKQKWHIHRSGTFVVM